MRKSRIDRLSFNSRIFIVAVHDIVMAALSFEIAVALRYVTYGAPQEFLFLWPGTLIFSVVCAITFWRIGLYRGIWYYASLNDLIAIFKAATLAILIFLPVLFVLTRLEDFGHRNGCGDCDRHRRRDHHNN